jgi:hypothetical protein
MDEARPRREGNQAAVRRWVPRVIVWHNAVARVPFRNDLFCGQYDTHYGIVRAEDGIVQDVTHEGSAVPDRLKLLKRS